jgi:hypothetical protein
LAREIKGIDDISVLLFILSGNHAFWLRHNLTVRLIFKREHATRSPTTRRLFLTVPSSFFSCDLRIFIHSLLSLRFLHAFNHHHHHRRHHPERKKKESMELCCYIQKLAALEVVVRKGNWGWAHVKGRKGKEGSGGGLLGRYMVDGASRWWCWTSDGRTGGALGARCMGMLEIAVIEPVCQILTILWFAMNIEGTSEV